MRFHLTDFAFTNIKVMFFCTLLNSPNRSDCSSNTHIRTNVYKVPYFILVSAMQRGKAVKCVNHDNAEKNEC